MLVETTSEIEEIFAPPGHNQTMPDNSFIEVSSLQEAEEEVHYPPYNFQVQNQLQTFNCFKLILRNTSEGAIVGKISPA